jgi:hypothetical protein
VLVWRTPGVPFSSTASTKVAFIAGICAKALDDGEGDEVREGDLGATRARQRLVQRRAIDLEEPGRHRAHAGRRGHRQARLHVGDDARRRAAKGRRLGVDLGATTTTGAGAALATLARWSAGSRRRTRASSPRPSWDRPKTGRTCRRRARRSVRTSLHFVTNSPVEGLAVAERRVAAPLASVICVHGALDRGGSFVRLVRRLARFDVVVYDRRGYQGSRDLVPVNLAAHIEDLSALITSEAERGPVILFGHSYGGLVTLGAAIALPSRVDMVVDYESPLPWVLRREHFHALQGDDPVVEAERSLPSNYG